MKITVLGTGRVGSAIIYDLARDFDVTAVDQSSIALDIAASKAAILCIQTDIQKEGALSSAIDDCDLVICAVPGFMGFETVKRVIERGKNIVDISFFGEDAFELEEMAQSQGVTAVVDCGVAPGLCNIILGHASQVFDSIDGYTCSVGGLPVERTWPYEYKTVFSPVDVLEEYTRPARLVENGREVVMPALSGVEQIDFPGIGVLEAFNTDGLRTLIKTMDIPNMKEKTLRYPGHAELMRVFKESGFFNKEIINVKGQQMRPLDLTAKLLFEQWQMSEGDEDITVMQVAVEGNKSGKTIRKTFELLDRYDFKTKTTSMARTTGYTCTIVARQILSGQIEIKGICPPEYVGQTKGCYENLMSEFKKRNIIIEETATESLSSD